MGRRRENPETIITRQIREMLRLIGIDMVKIWGGPMMERGFPDLVGEIPPGGRALYIEVKTPKGRLSEEQEAFLERKRSRGAVAFVARSPHDAIKALATVGFKPAERIKMQFPGRPEA